MSRGANKPKFKGFGSPNYTMVPDELFDELLADLAGAELKVLLYIVRRTFGFKKGSDRISKAQLETGIQRSDGTVLDRGTGLSRRAIRLAVDSLVEQEVLIKYSHESRERGYEATEYALNVVGSGDTPWVLSTQARGTKVPKPLGRGVPIQQTVLQETVQQQDDDDIRGALEAFGISAGQAQRLAETYPLPLILEKLDQVSYLVERQSSLVSRNPQGFLIKAIEDNYLPEKPQGYKTKAEREAQAQQRQAQDAELERARLDREQTIAVYKQHQQPKAIPGTTLTTATSWEQTLRALQTQMTAANFNMWLKQTILVDCRDGQALIAAPSTFVADWLQARMVPIVKRALVETLGQPVELQFTVAPELVSPGE